MTVSWLGRLLGVAPQAEARAETSPTGLSQRVAELEEEVQFLAGALKRLRGRVTGSVRTVESDGKPEDPPADETVARDAKLNEEIFRRRRGLSRTG